MKEVSVSCSFDSSGGAYPNGYCVYLWDGAPILVKCYCKEGYGPPINPMPGDVEFEPFYYTTPCEQL